MQWLALALFIVTVALLERITFWAELRRDQIPTDQDRLVEALTLIRSATDRLAVSKGEDSELARALEKASQVVLESALRDSKLVRILDWRRSRCIVVSLVALVAAAIIAFSDFFDAASKPWAFAIVGSVVGFWVNK